MVLLKAWIEKERFHGEIVNCLTLILQTRGCSWRKCYMCSYYLDAKEDANPEADLNGILEKKKNKAEIIKIFTSGSFFDDRELDRDLRKRIYEKLKRKGFKKLIVESRPEFINEETAKEIREAGIEIEVGIGVETSNDYYREKLINKGFSFSDFVEASKIVRDAGGRVKAYLLLKPPLLSEKEALDDILKSIEDVRPHSDIISLNLMTVHRKTLVERLWKAGIYRPPWLWSAVEILKKAETEIICDPVAAGKIRGPHNCFKCDGRVAEEIREFSLTQDKSVFKTECECKKIWELCLKGEVITDAPLTP